MRNVHDVIEVPHAIFEVLLFCFSKVIVRKAYFLIDLDFSSLLIFDNQWLNILTEPIYRG